MAGPWFVDPDNGLTTNNGLTPETPWLLIPGQTGADAQTGYAVVAGDTINIKNGTTTTFRINLLLHNLTYRGYGIASNVLTLRLPSSWNPLFVRTVRVAREWGVHEGMWTIDASGNDEFGAAIATNVRTGAVIEDVNILGPQVGDRQAVAFAASANNVSGVTMRRFAISGATGAGITAYTKNVLLEYGRIEFTKGDNILLNTSAANVARDGSVDTLRYLELRDPNRQIAGGEDIGVDGDCIHTTPTAGAYDGTLVMHDILMDKSTYAKQAAVLHQTSATGSIKINNIHITGNGDVPFIIGHIKKLVEITNVAVVGNYNLDTVSGSLPMFRFAATESTPPAYGMDTGSVLRIKNVTVNGIGAGFYRCSQSDIAQLFDGTIEIDGVTALGANVSPFSSAATFSFDGAGNLNNYGANFQLRIRNCNSQMTGSPHVRMPAGSANSSKWQISGNICGASAYVIGGTTYNTLAEFQAAHSAATVNTEGQLDMMTPEGRPLPGSSMLESGVYIEPSRDIEGKKRPNPPTPGAFDVAALRRIGA